MTNIETRRSRVTGNQLSVGRVEAFGIERDGRLKWMASCDDHGTFVMTETKATAISSDGLDFCDDCRAEQAHHGQHLQGCVSCYAAKGLL